jgi:protein subunit release factor B
VKIPSAPAITIIGDRRQHRQEGLTEKFSLLVKAESIEYNHLMQRSVIGRGASDGYGDRLRELGLRKEDLVEKFIRSAGKGGQNVNKTSTCVYLKHLPTGIEVKCQQERSQAMNRITALRLLAEKIASIARREREARKQEREKARRSKRPRPARLKERILESKKRTGEKKKLRAKASED